MDLCSAVSRGRHTRARLPVLAAITAVASFTLAGCGDDQASATTSTTTSPAADSSNAPTTVALIGDAAVVADALLTPADLGNGWGDASEQMSFPNSAEMAATVPECAPYVDLVFAGGADHGVGQSAALTKGPDVLFTYVVVFPTEAAATAMLDAVQSPGFDACWAKFNDVAVPAMPIGATSATYENDTPPDLTFTADQSSVKSLVGTVTMGGSDLPDTCVCTFARSGRGVVEVHSTASAFTASTRSAIIQQAIDKLSTRLAQG